MKSFISSLVLIISIQINVSATPLLAASISNYPLKYVYAFRCFGDSLIFIDSLKTDEKGKFNFAQFSSKGIYRFNLPSNQWFYVLSTGSAATLGKEAGRQVEENIEIKTVYRFDMFNNLASDSLEVIKSDENKLFYKFQRAQKQATVANFVLKEMIRLYPLQDPFHKVIENEYFERYKAMDELLKESSHSPSAQLIINAYYQPMNPDWKGPDDWRDSVIATHYFDYFHPSENGEFYMNTSILPEKIDNYFDLFSFLMRVNRETNTDYEKKIKNAADEFLKHTQADHSVHEFCLKYILKKLDKRKMYDAMFSVYDKWVYQAVSGDCSQTYPSLNQWREKISVLRNVQIGNAAPDFEVVSGKMNMYQIPADYTLLVFWASWCPHCTLEIPKIKKAVEDFQNSHKEKSVITLFISLDNDEKAWKDFVEKNSLGSNIHLCDLKGWQGRIVRQYNVFATPSMFLLNKDKKIINKPESEEQLNFVLSKQ